ncbi:hypothetical protein AB4407_07665 [Vibrio sp. 10N.261.46.E11]
MKNLAPYITKYIIAQIENGTSKAVIDAELGSYLDKLNIGNEH